MLVLAASASTSTAHAQFSPYPWGTQPHLPTNPYTVRYLDCEQNVYSISFTFNGSPVSYTGGPATCEDGSTGWAFSVPLTLNVGANTLNAMVCRMNIGCYQEGAIYRYGELALDVTAPSATTLRPSSSGSFTISVLPTNSGFPYNRSINLEVSCSAPVASCSFNPDGPTPATSVGATYGSSSTHTIYFNTNYWGGTGSISVRARYASEGTGAELIADSAVIAVDVSNAPMPQVLANGTVATWSTATVQPSTVVSQIFHVRGNGGSGSATYSVAARCGNWTSGGCTPSQSSVTVASGQQVPVTVTYTSGPPQIGPPMYRNPNNIQLVATLAGVTADSGVVATSLADVVPPTVTILQPGRDTVITNWSYWSGAHSLPVSAEVCDPDGQLGAAQLMAGSQGYGSGSFSATTSAGCRFSGVSSWSGVQISPLDQQLVVTISDGAGHTATATRIVTYAPPIAEFRPQVTPRSETLPDTIATRTQVDFQVRNIGFYPATYQLSAACGSLSGCTVSPSSVTLQPQQVASATVTFAIPTSTSGTQTVRLVALYDIGWSSPAAAAVVSARQIADTGAVSFVLPTPRPLVLAHDTTVTVAPNASVAQSFRVRANGSVGIGSYSLRAECGTWTTGGCAPSVSSLTLTAGQEQVVTVNYTAGPPVTGPDPGPMPIRLIASSTTTTAVDTGTARTSLADVLTPIATIVVPGRDTTVGAPTGGMASIPLRVEWCDPDGTLTGPYVYLNGTALALNVQLITRPGCRTAREVVWNSVDLPMGTNTIRTHVYDLQMHLVETTRTVTVVPAQPTQLNIYAPAADTVIRDGLRNPIPLVRVYWCDQDDAIVSRVVKIGTVTLPDNFTPQPTPACVEHGYSEWTNVAIPGPWEQNIVATVTDAAGHVATMTRRLYYDAPAAQLRPEVTPKGGAVHLAATAPAKVTFSVRNAGEYPATYALAADCGGFAGCTVTPTIAPAPGTASTVDVTFSVPASGGSSSIRLIAGYGSPSGSWYVADTGSVALTAESRPVTPVVSPKGPVVDWPLDSAYTARFAITNPTSATRSVAFDWRARCEPPTSCATSNGSTPVLPPGGADSVTVVVRSPATAGAISRVYVAANDPSATTAADSGWADVRAWVPAQYALTITPTAETILAQTSEQRTRTFTITNAGSASNGVTIDVRCELAVSCSSNSLVTSLPAGNSQTVTVSFSAPPAVGDSGFVVVTAVGAVGMATATGRIKVTTLVPTGVTVVSRTINPGANVRRDQCLAIAAGDDAAYECGDLRVVHALPATTTMNKTRAPTLVYNSAHAAARVALSVDVSYVPTAGAAPASAMRLVVKRAAGGAQLAEKTYPWADSLNGSLRRMTIELLAAPSDTASAALIDYVVEAQPLASGSALATGQGAGTAVMIDRRRSPYGVGWWVDGLEQLFSLDATRMLWVGGDGSSRVYQQQGASALWLADPMSRVDSLVKQSDGGWKRHLPNRAYVLFDWRGLHAATVNAQQHATRFVQLPKSDLTISLDTIALPAPTAGMAPRYVFHYAEPATGAGRLRLSSVTAPPVGGVSRNVLVGYTPRSGGGGDAEGRIRSFAGPDATGVWFDYDLTTSWITGRTNRRDNTWVYSYDAGGKLATSILTHASLAGGQIRSSYCAAESVGANECAPVPALTANASTRFDGPRTDVGDTTRFWVTQYGAPSKIRNAIGQVTKIERTNERWPLLATAVQQPNGLRTTAEYDEARGLLNTLTEFNPLGDGANAVTTYEWDARFDNVVSVKPPLDSATRYTYGSDGLTAKVRHGQDSVTFTYTTGSNLLETATASDGGVQRYAYDALANLETSTSPKGYVTAFGRDAIGRVIATVSPTDTMQTVSLKLHDSVTYDIMDRVTAQVSGGVGAGQAKVRVWQVYDQEGNLKRVKRISDPDPAAIDTLFRDYAYDAVHRQTNESGSEGLSIDTEYDGAGNTVRSGRTPTMRAAYDVMNRLQRRYRITTGADVETFTYDADGRLATAVNGTAEVGRTYYPNGLLHTETQALAGGAAPHTLTYSYDLLGRRTALGHPATYGGTTSYSYDAMTGQLETVTDHSGNIFRYGYDAMGRLDSLRRRQGVAGEVLETRLVDVESRAYRRTYVLNPGGAQTTIRDEGISYDARGKALGGGGSVVSYNVLGQVKSGTWPEREDLEHDALGNMLERRSFGHSPATIDFTYWGGGIGQLKSQRTSRFRTDVIDSTAYGYGFLGNLQNETSLFHPIRLDADTAYWLRRTTVSGYEPETNRPSSITFTHDSLRYDWDAPFYHYTRTTSYGYDALGRRVTHGTTFGPDCFLIESASPCVSEQVRVLWDGDQILYELRDAFGGGTIRYTHGTGIDDPLIIDKGGEELVPLSNWRGKIVDGICGTTVCTISQVHFPGRGALAYAGTSQRPPSWWGSLIEEGRDGSGLQYMRNRYYDPQTGRFTQQDPIGLAGGLNLYGFAAGDPVNYSDPFGLCPKEVRPGSRDAILCAWIEAGLMAAGTDIGAVLGGGAGLLTGPGALVASPAGALAGAGLGAATGYAAGNALTQVLFSKKGDIKQVEQAAKSNKMTPEQRREFGDFLESEKAAGRGGTKNDRGDFRWSELMAKAKEFLEHW